MSEPIEELVALGFNREHLTDRPIEPGFDAVLDGAWALHLSRGTRWVINPRRAAFADDGPLVHHLDCSTLHGVAPCDERYSDRQIHPLFWADVAHRRDHKRLLVGWCEKCWSGSAPG